MNPIQKISQNIETRRRKQLLGIDVEAPMQPGQVRDLWFACKIERIKRQLGQRAGDARSNTRGAEFRLFNTE